ncbi:MAG: Uma2 family endonuclease [Acidobacteriota bacterium]
MIVISGQSRATPRAMPASSTVSITGVSPGRSARGPEAIELPLTPELFLNPQLEDKMVQGQAHTETGIEIFTLLNEHFRPQMDVMVVFDMKHVFGRGLPSPAPDVSVTRGIRKRFDPRRRSFDARKEGVVPCLVIEVVSPYSIRVRDTDLKDKVKAYEKVGIAEYLVVDSPSMQPHAWYSLLGYRLDAARRYQPIEPDAEGRILSESTGLWFQISPDRARVLIYEHPSGRRLLTPAERADRAESERARLQEELERLRGGR